MHSNLTLLRLSKKDLENLPIRPFQETTTCFDVLVVKRKERNADTRFPMLSVYSLKDGKPDQVLSNCSDELRINCDVTLRAGIDFLPGINGFRLYADGSDKARLQVGMALSLLRINVIEEGDEE